MALTEDDISNIAQRLMAVSKALRDKLQTIDHKIENAQLAGDFERCKDLLDEARVELADLDGYASVNVTLEVLLRGAKK